MGTGELNENPSGLALKEDREEVITIKPDSDETSPNETMRLIISDEAFSLNIIEKVLGEHAEGYINFLNNLFYETDEYGYIVPREVLEDENPYVLERYFTEELHLNEIQIRNLIDDAVDKYIIYESELKAEIKRGHDTTFFILPELPTNKMERILAYELKAHEFGVKASINMSRQVAEDMLERKSGEDVKLTNLENDIEIARKQPKKAWAVRADLAHIRAIVVDTPNGVEALDIIFNNFKLERNKDATLDAEVDRIRDEIIRLAFSKAEEMGVILRKSQVPGYMTAITIGDGNDVLLGLKELWRELLENLYLMDKIDEIPHLDIGLAWQDFRIAVDPYSDPGVEAIDLYPYPEGHIIGYTIPTGEENPLNQVNNALADKKLEYEFIMVGDSNDNNIGANRVRNETKGTTFQVYDLRLIMKDDRYYDISTKTFKFPKIRRGKMETPENRFTTLLPEHGLDDVFTMKDLRELQKVNTSFIHPQGVEELLLNYFRNLAKVSDLPGYLPISELPEFSLPQGTVFLEADLTGFSITTELCAKYNVKGPYLVELMKKISGKLITLGGMTDNFAGDAISALVLPESFRPDALSDELRNTTTQQLQDIITIDTKNPSVRALLIQMTIKQLETDFISELGKKLPEEINLLIEEVNSKSDFERVMLKLDIPARKEFDHDLAKFLLIIKKMQYLNKGVDPNQLRKKGTKLNNSQEPEIPMGKRFGIRTYFNQAPPQIKFKHVGTRENGTMTAVVEEVPTPRGFGELSKVATGSDAVIGVEAFRLLPSFYQRFYEPLVINRQVRGYKLDHNTATEDSTIYRALGVISNPN